MIRMSEVVIISYLFKLIGNKQEVHTEVRVFGFDWWFEKDGAMCVPSIAKERHPEYGYTLERKISFGILFYAEIFIAYTL